MSELMSSSSNAMISSTAKQKPAQGRLVSLLWFPLSNPLYFSYLIFFSPYLFKLFSFLSPLFATTTLLILSLLTTTANLSPPTALEEEDQLHFRYFESEVYKIVFDTTADTPTTSPESNYLSDEEVVKEMMSSASEDENIIKEDDQSAYTKNVIIISELLLSPVKVTVTHNKALLSSPSPDDHHQTGFASPELDDDGFESPEKSTGVNESPARENLGGSMRNKKEKEWRRTLACKLFEERHSRGGGEGMDSLWETYEAENDNKQRNDSNETPKNDNKKKTSKMRRNSTKSSGSMSSISGSADGGGKKGITENGGQFSNINDNGGYLYGNYNGGGDDVDDDEDWDDEGTNGKLCCLQALKFSAGKMGKPNLIKFSKAFKGIGWFHTVAKHAKKRYY